MQSWQLQFRNNKERGMFRFLKKRNFQNFPLFCFISFQCHCRKSTAKSSTAKFAFFLKQGNIMSGKATGIVTGKNGCENDTFSGNETLTVVVENTGRMDAPALTLGEQKITLKQGQKFPITYNIAYDEEEASKVPDYGFTISARIEDNQGQLLYTDDTRTSVKDNKIEVKKV
ncbi:hypothetical protein I4U23_011374 [Adineta vaga]|nr:hypothetical protein I4U23_011374 [Adineta vaga]